VKTKTPKTSKVPRTAISLVAITATHLALAETPAGPPAEALINKLVEKGILTTKEAGDLKAESNDNFNSAFRAKTGMPQWVTGLKFSGDFRGRFDGIYGNNDALPNRDRLRYRLRFGITAMLMDNFEIGFRLNSGEPVNGFGGNPISSNTTMADNGSKKLIGVGLAYAKWTPLDTADWNGAFTVGKMENPLAFPTAMMFGKDYAPEGLAAQLAYKLNAHHTLKFNAAAFVLDELAASGKDPYLGAAQLRLDSAWNNKISSSIGVTALGIANKDGLVNDGLPNVNRGNTRNASGAPTHSFNPVHADATVTYTLDHVLGFPGKFPVSVGGEYLNNPAAPDKNQAWSAGFCLGKSGKKGQWDLSYRWMELEADSWFEEVVDVDFAGYYQAQQANSGFTSTSNPAGSGYTGGTNIRGHILKLDYSPTDALTFSATWFLTELINESPAGSKSGANRIQIDGMWKF